jgi:hypothetical protein
MPSCSKAPRGLFVLLRVGRIFTAISTSPGPSLRQCSDRYAVRAGRNLPDKEFRSVILALFPEKPDFIFLDWYSFQKRFGGSFRYHQGLDAHFVASSSGSSGISKNPDAFLSSKDAFRRTAQSVPTGFQNLEHDKPYAHHDYAAPRRNRKIVSGHIAVAHHVRVAPL